MLKNVVIVSESADGKGGASVAALNSAIALAETGLNVLFFAAAGPFQPSAPVPPTFKVSTMQDGFDLIKAGKLQRAAQSFWNGAAAEALLEVLRRYDPSDTVIHIHSFQVQLTSSVVRAAVGKGFRVIMTAHDYGIACPYSGLYNYRTAAPCGKRGGSLACALTACSQSGSIVGKAWHISKDRFQKSIGGVPSLLSHLICVSDFSRDMLHPYVPPTVPISVVNNAQDLPDIGARPLEPNSTFVYVGRLTEEKGALVAAKGAALAQAPIQFVGTGPLEEAILRACPSAQMLGWRSPAEVREIMWRARALVFPSLLYEVQGMVVQEAQSVGLPVVVSDVTAASRTVADGREGIHFKSGDASSLASALTTLRDNEVAEGLGKAAYQRFWSDPPTLRRHVEDTLAIYRSVLPPEVLA